MNTLPVITSCGGCGACCTHLGGPPGYAALLLNPNMEHWDDDDPKRLAEAPPLARADLLDWIGDEMPDEGPCCWFDAETRKCRWYAWRPSICREFEMGGESCRMMTLNVYFEDDAREVAEEALREA